MKDNTRYVVGDLFTNILENHVYLVNTNGVINSRGSLVMGKGSARQLAELLPGSAAQLGKEIVKKGILKQDYYLYYNLFMKIVNTNIRYGAFQTKTHWKDPSTVDLIVKSLEGLKSKALECPSLTFHLPMPGVGYGGLSTQVVKSLIANCELPQNVLVHTFR